MNDIGSDQAGKSRSKDVSRVENSNPGRQLVPIIETAPSVYRCYHFLIMELKMFLRIE